jgi:hypothetical protein
MEQKSLNLLIVGFLTLILGLALIGTVASNVLDKTQKIDVSNEGYNLTDIGCFQGGQVNGTGDADCNITVTNAPTGWKSYDCPLTRVVVTNNSGTALTLDTDYSVYVSTGVIQMFNTTDTEVTVNAEEMLIDYTYCGDEYLTSEFGRSTSNLIPGFFALALLGISLLLFYSVAKAEGVFNL